jgi:hypothetical protein
MKEIKSISIFLIFFLIFTAIFIPPFQEILILKIIFSILCSISLYLIYLNKNNIFLKTLARTLFFMFLIISSIFYFYSYDIMLDNIFLYSNIIYGYAFIVINLIVIVLSIIFKNKIANKFYLIMDKL